jgi:hypothetical protein
MAVGTARPLSISLTQGYPAGSGEVQSRLALIGLSRA